MPGLPRLIQERLRPVPLRGQFPDFLQEFLCLFRVRLPLFRSAGKDGGGIRRGRAFRKNDLARSRAGEAFGAPGVKSGVQAVEFLFPCGDIAAEGLYEPLAARDIAVQAGCPVLQFPELLFRGAHGLLSEVRERRAFGIGMNRGAAQGTGLAGSEPVPLFLEIGNPAREQVIVLQKVVFLLAEWDVLLPEFTEDTFVLLRFLSRCPALLFFLLNAAFLGGDGAACDLKGADGV